MKGKTDKKSIKKNVNNWTENTPIIGVEDLMDTKEVCEFLKIGIDTLYRWVEEGIIPHYRITGKKILFNRKVISQWLYSIQVG